MEYSNLFIISFTPMSCPNCQKDLSKQWLNKGNREDFLAGASFTCDCGLHYQYVPANLIQEAARKAGGDL